MSFEFERGESVAHSVRRIAGEEIQAAIALIDDKTAARNDVVHDVRKRCKKLRGLLRLARLSFPDIYKRENAYFRDTARLLSEARDSQTLIDTYDKLMEVFADQVNRAAFGSIRRRLTLRQNALLDDAAGLSRRLDEVRDRLASAGERVADWSIDQRGFGAIEGGLKKTYARANKCLAKASKKGTGEAFHEWRKRVKYHWYHLRMLTKVSEPMIDTRADEAHRLSQLLGDEHDLFVFENLLEANSNEFGDDQNVATTLALTCQRRQSLQADSVTLGTRLFAESADDFAKRLEAYWQSWQSTK